MIALNHATFNPNNEEEEPSIGPQILINPRYIISAEQLTHATKVTIGGTGAGRAITVTQSAEQIANMTRRKMELDL